MYIFIPGIQASYVGQGTDCLCSSLCFLSGLFRQSIVLNNTLILLLYEIFFFSPLFVHDCVFLTVRQTNSILGFHFRISESRLQIHLSAPLTSNRACRKPSLLAEDNIKTRKHRRQSFLEWDSNPRQWQERVYALDDVTTASGQLLNSQTIKQISYK